jgi:hypothetical protein
MEDEGWAGYIWDRSSIKLAIVLGGLFVFAIFMGISSYRYHLNTLKRIYLEKTASDMLGTKVKIGGLYWRPAENNAILTDIDIANPPGFTGPSAIHIMALRMQMDSVSPSSIVFNQITIAHTFIYLALGENVSNLAILHAHMARTTPVLAADGKPFTVVIKDIRTKEGMAVQPDVIPPDRQFLADDVAPLHLTGIGEKEKGIPVAQAVALMVDQIIRQSYIAAAGVGALEAMSNGAVLDIKSEFDMGPDFVDLAGRGAAIGHGAESGSTSRLRLSRMPRR